MLKIGDFAKMAQVSTKTVRYYDQRGLLKPAWIDRFSGYRYYTAEQLTRLNHILALKELRFTLDQIGHILETPLSLDELRGMFRLKHAELERHIQEEQSRLARIESRLAQIEQGDALVLSMIGKQKEQLNMNPEIVTKPAFTAIGIACFSDNKNKEISQLWGELMPRQQEIKDRSQTAYGLCGKMDEDGRFHYLAAFASEQQEIPEGMTRWEVPDQTYAVFPCTLDNIGETYQFVFDQWFPQVTHQLADSPDFEFYPAEFDPTSNKEMAIYIPIK